WAVLLAAVSVVFPVSFAALFTSDATPCAKPIVKHAKTHTNTNVKFFMTSPFAEDFRPVSISWPRLLAFPIDWDDSSGAILIGGIPLAVSNWPVGRMESAQGRNPLLMLESLQIRFGSQGFEVPDHSRSADALGLFTYRKAAFLIANAVAQSRGRRCGPRPRR